MFSKCRITSGEVAKGGNSVLIHVLFWISFLFICVPIDLKEHSPLRHSGCTYFRTTLTILIYLTYFEHALSNYVADASNA